MTLSRKSGFLVRIDLTESTTHQPEFLSVEVTGVWPREWPPERLRFEAAKWAGVPVEQVSVPDAVARDSDA